MKKKQDILNAFRERYLKTPDGWILDGKNGAEIDNWLLNTLTEFEREAYDDGYEKCFSDICKLQKKARKFMSQLEKEKHT